MRGLSAIAAATFVAFNLQISGALAQDSWPTKPITLVVPFAPGGNTDLIARTIAPGLQEKLGQPVIVENKPGAGGTIATAEVAAAAPDGYTMQIGDISTHAIAPLIYKNLTYDPRANFTPVVQITSVSLVFVANPQLGVNTVADLVALAKKDPDALSYASSGIGSPQHLAFEFFKSKTGITPVHIPYNGSAPALTDVVAGHVSMMIDGTAVPHVKNGALKALAVTSDKRSQALPDVPTMKEAGVPDYVFTSWHGVFFPAGVPDDIVTKVNEAINEILQEEAVQKRFADLNISIAGGTPADFKRFVGAEGDKMQPLVAISGASQNQ